MKFLSLAFLLAFTVACGKNGSSSSPQKEEGCNLNGSTISCDSIEGTDGLGVDLLESMIDVPVKLTDSEIIFMSDKVATSQGRRISCKTAVKNGEAYRYALRGSSLVVMTSEGSYEMSRLSSGDSIIGTWAWNGYIDQGTHIIRQITFLSDTRVIMRTNCEL